jgi:hypothetical protein
MKGKGIFISTLLVIDTFLVSYFVGFNSRHVPVVDPSLPPLAPAAPKEKETPPAKPKADDTKAAHTESTKPATKKAGVKPGKAAHSSSEGKKHSAKKASKPQKSSEKKSK